MDDDMIPLIEAVERAREAFNDWQTGIEFILPRLGNGLSTSRCESLTMRRGNQYGRDILPSPFDRMPSGIQRNCKIPAEFWSKVGSSNRGWATGNFKIQVGSDSAIEVVGVQVEQELIAKLPVALAPTITNLNSQTPDAGPSKSGANPRKKDWENFAAALAVVVYRHNLDGLSTATIYAEVSIIIQNSDRNNEVVPSSWTGLRLS